MIWQVDEECRAVTADHSLPDMLELTGRLRQTEIQLTDQKRQCRHLKKVARHQQREIDVRDKWVQRPRGSSKVFENEKVFVKNSLLQWS